MFLEVAACAENGGMEQHVTLATHIGLVLAVAGVTWSTAAAQEMTRISVDSAGLETNGDSYVTAVTPDGRFVSFISYASNLVPGDTNGVVDGFVHDRAIGTTERVTVDSFGAQGNGSSFIDSMSADGRYIAFESLASNLVASDTNGTMDVFVHDRLTGATDRVSMDSTGTEANGASDYPTLSRDGRLVAFTSSASNLVVNDTNGFADIFVHDCVTGITERISVDSNGAEGNGHSYSSTISYDGSAIAFSSLATNFVVSDTNGAPDTFVRDLVTGTTQRVSVDSSGAEANGGSVPETISNDGRLVAMFSLATNLVVGDTNGTYDVFVHDRTNGVTERISVDTFGAEGNDQSAGASFSADGRLIAFWSAASNLVTGDTNGVGDTFLHDRVTGVTDRISVDPTGTQGNQESGGGVLSADGQVIAFSSLSSNLVATDSNSSFDVFVRAPCTASASWTNFGSGFPGTNGVPGFTSQSTPLLGSTVTLDIDNSFGKSTVGLFFVGFQRATIHSAWGGDLLLLPFLTSVVALPAPGTSLSGVIPNDDALCGLAIDLQVIESDPGASRGVSFTQGLELVLGH